MHDWTKLKPGGYHMFHGAWLYAIARELNGGLLPAGYFAATEQRVLGVEADVLALRPGGREPPAGPVYDPAGRATRPPVGLLERAEKVARAANRRVAVRREDTEETVAVIELVSPGNTKDRGEYAAFVGKAADLLAAGIHLLVIDPFRPPKHAPGGLHAAIWKKVARQRKGRPPFAVPTDRPLLAASYCTSSAEITAAVEVFAVGQPVPAMPLYLTADGGYVTVPLEDAYAAAWPDVPAFWRAALEG